MGSLLFAATVMLAQPLGGNYGLVRPPLGGVASADLDLDGTYKLILDADADTYWESLTDDTARLYVAGAEELEITSATFQVSTGALNAPPLIDVMTSGGGSTSGLRLRVDAGDAMVFHISDNTSASGSNLIFSTFTNRNDDFSGMVSDQLDPHVYITSRTAQATATTEWGLLRFDFTAQDFQIDAGEGAVSITQSLKLPITNVADGASPYTATEEDHTVVCDVTTAVTVNLPAGETGQVYVVKNDSNSGGSCTVDGNGAETIDGSATQVLAAGESLIMQWDGDEWHSL